MDLYIYYRVAHANEQQLLNQVHAMQARLRAEYKIGAALKRRPPPAATDLTPQTMDTWMEVYLDVPDDFESNLQGIFEQAAYAALIDGSRHVEYFLDCTSCA